MAHITLPEGVPGIRSLAMFRPESGQHIYALAQVLLRGPSPMTQRDRELVAAFVSSRNDCAFCTNSHAAAARYLSPGQSDVVNRVITDYETAPISEKMKMLLHIAGKVQKSGRAVMVEDIAEAHKRGATEHEIHDTVLIAATFCMFNRYVDGLSAFTPTDQEAYGAMGKRLAEKGYALPSKN
jgi:uncharacterized peroxidase-related enzyme